MQTKIGWTLLVASLGGFLGLMAQEIGSINQWEQMTTTSFVAKVLGHLAVLLIGMAGGNQIPTIGKQEK